MEHGDKPARARGMMTNPLRKPEKLAQIRRVRNDDMEVDKETSILNATVSTFLSLKAANK